MKFEKDCVMKGSQVIDVFVPRCSQDHQNQNFTVSKMIASIIL